MLSTLFLVVFLIEALYLSLSLMPNIGRVWSSTIELEATREVLKIHAMEQNHSRAYPEIGYACSIEQLRTLQPLKEVSQDGEISYSEGRAWYTLRIESCSGHPALGYVLKMEQKRGNKFEANTQVLCVDEKGRVGRVASYWRHDRECVPGEIITE